jgi:hypothetical protein
MKKKRTSNREFWERHREQFERTDRLLRERIAYHDAKLSEENPGWDPPKNGDEWEAYYRAKWAAQDAAKHEPE